MPRSLHRSPAWRFDTGPTNPRRELSGLAAHRKEDTGLNVLDTLIQPAVAPHAAAVLFRRPELADGAHIQRLIQSSPPLDVNSTYAYLLLCQHFRDTCVVARRQAQLAGFVSAYIPPATPQVLFIWQVAVHPDARGERLGAAMLDELLARDSTTNVRYVETTVSPSNLPSRRLFAALARDRGVALQEQEFFTPNMFGGADHEAERLLRIGPF